MIKQRNIALCIVFSIITFGIYALYWFVCLTNDANQESGQTDATSGGVALLLTIVTCNIYGWFWAYKMGEKIDAIKAKNGQSAGNSSILFLLLQLCGLGIVSYAIMQLKLAGINVKDFWSFIEANQMLDKLYAFSKKYEKMSPQEQVIFLMEAEKVFNAFDKVPKMIWEEEYEKYEDVLNTYKNIKILRWSASN